MKISTYKIQIEGQVQGVGFRPFVFNLAIENNLFGTVSNNSNGVVIYINTNKVNAEKFLKQLILKKPLVSIISSYHISEENHKEFHTFLIIPSVLVENINIPITPDFAVCKDCKQEISNKNNRRYNYPFTTCIHCGPRYAITNQYPFERNNTSLNNYKMCVYCKKEYENPINKRFHSQTNSCNDCGIVLSLKNRNNENVENNNEDNKLLDHVAGLILKGKVIALKNTNGYLLCCDATNKKAINILRKQKQRPSKPFAVIYPSIKNIHQDFHVSKEENKALISNVAPIVILQNKAKLAIEFESIAPKLSQTGVMLPSSSLLQLLLHKIQKPLVATSGNIHGLPIISTENEAQIKLKNVADFFLHNSLDIQFPQDDSVVKYSNNQKILLRRSRGLAPNFIGEKMLDNDVVLAMGAHLKCTFTFVPNRQIYVSQYFGNLDSFEVSERFLNTINQYFKLFNTIPKTILIDKHLQYQSSIMGNDLSKKHQSKLVKIQHHKAHFASVLGEHSLFNIKEKILGVVWDGTGFGEDKNIWGGEFFIYQNNKISRVAHFDYFDWLANDKMAKEPRLSLFSLLDEQDRIAIVSKFSKEEWKIYSKKIKTNTLKTSSVGRLFDAVASALDIVDINSFEAEAPILLEQIANKPSNHQYENYLYNVDYKNIPSKKIISKILNEYKKGIPKEYIARSFIFTMAILIFDTSRKFNTKTIACSGGVFQNALLVYFLKKLSKSNKISLKLNETFSSNDENISFGQLMYYKNIKI